MKNSNDIFVSNKRRQIGYHHARVTRNVEPFEPQKAQQSLKLNHPFYLFAISLLLLQHASIVAGQIQESVCENRRRVSAQGISGAQKTMKSNLDSYVSEVCDNLVPVAGFGPEYFVVENGEIKQKIKPDEPRFIPTRPYFCDRARKAQGDFQNVLQARGNTAVDAFNRFYAGATNNDQRLVIAARALNTGVDWSVARELHEDIHCFIDQGASPRGMFYEGKTFLYYLATKDTDQLRPMLLLALKQGAEPDEICEKDTNKTARQLAKENGLVGVLNLMERYYPENACSPEAPAP